MSSGHVRPEAAGKPKERFKRSRFGCLTCRSHRKRCDETRETCGRCNKLSYECVWPAQPVLKPYAKKDPWRNLKRPIPSSFPKESCSPPASQPRPESAASPLPTHEYATSTSHWEAQIGSSFDPWRIYNQSETSVGAQVYSPATSFTTSPPRDESSISAPPPQGHLLPPNPINSLPLSISTSTTTLPPNFWSSLLCDARLVGFHGGGTEESSSTFYHQDLGRPFPGAASTSNYPEFLESPFIKLERSPSMSFPPPFAPPPTLDVDAATGFGVAMEHSPSPVLSDSRFTEYTSTTRYALGSPLVQSAYKSFSKDLHSQSEMLHAVSEAVAAGLRHRGTPGARGLWRKAWQMVGLAVKRGDVLLETKLRALRDLGYWEFAENGAEAYLASLKRVEALLLSHVQHQSVINISDVHAVCQSDLLEWMWADTLRSITEGSSTTFCYVHAPVPRRDQAMRGLQCITGTPDLLAVTLAEISNLASTIDREASNLLNRYPATPPYLDRANFIASTIASFCPALTTLSPRDSMTNLAHLAVQEIWRHATWIHYHQRVYRRSPLEEPLASSLTQILHLLDVVERHLPEAARGGGLEAPLALPVFLASTIAVKDEDRRKCRVWMDRLGRYRGFGENLAFVDKLWWESDLQGVPLDWHEAREAGGGPVTFI